MHCAAGRADARRQRGFTLIEIVVVAFIIAIMASTIAVRFNFDTSDKRLREEVRRLDVLLHLAWEQSLIEGRSVGLEITRDSYRFFLYDQFERRWITMQDDRLLKERTLPEGTRFDLRMENTDIELPGPEDDDDDDDNDGLDNIQPQIMLLSSGEVTPFNVFVENDDTDVRYELIVDAIGGSEIVEHDDGL
jgi:general secretion pathway protein H